MTPSQERVASIVVPLPRGRTAPRLELGRLLPSVRSLLAAFAVLSVGITCFFVARDTGVFAVRTIEVDGAPATVAGQVRAALRDELGTSLLRLDRAAVLQRVEAIPTVARVSLDRAFPHTLHLTIVAERPVAVARQGSDAWLLSARGRVMAHLARRACPHLPRLWIAKGPQFAAGAMAPASLDEPLAALAPVSSMRFPARIASVRAGKDELTLLLHSGLELRLGDAHDVRLKLAVAAKVLPLVPSGTRYLDVSVPERPVAGAALETPASTPQTAAAATKTAGSGAEPGGASTGGSLNSQVQVEGRASTTP